MLDIAQQLLAYEAAANTSSETNFSAADRVLQQLRLPLFALVGAQGVRVLVTRALVLAAKQVPGLKAVKVRADGSLNGFDGLHADELPAAGAALIGQLLGLLTIFIGEVLTLRIVSGVWPDFTASNVRGGPGENDGS